MEKFLAGMVVVLGGLALLVSLSLLFSVPTTLIWNGCLVGAIDGIHNIGWLQGWGLNVLFAIIFRGIKISNKD